VYTSLPLRARVNFVCSVVRFVRCRPEKDSNFEVASRRSKFEGCVDALALPTGSGTRNLAVSLKDEVSFSEARGVFEGASEEPPPRREPGSSVRLEEGGSRPSLLLALLLSVCRDSVRDDDSFRRKESF